MVLIIRGKIILYFSNKMAHSHELENSLKNDRTGLNFDPKVAGSDITRIVPKVQLSA